MNCTCGHMKLSHQYIRIIGDNTGPCLALGCTCKIYKKERR